MQMTLPLFTSAILAWYREHGRSLPWRDTQSPYAIWLSEIILQQTRVEQGRDYWLRFVHTYPTVEALAAASEDDVLRLWQGLGYYSRARHLHQAAQQIASLGHFPDTFDEIRQLKGVGDYTAAAIASFAFGEREAVVDGNVYRVLARYLAIDTPINTTRGKHEFAALATSLLPADGQQTALYNQGLMDFGALQCTPQSPKCMDCPLAETCEALRQGRVSELPVKEKKIKTRTRHLTYIYIRCNRQTALHRRGKGDIWQGLWEPFLLPEGRQPADLSGIADSNIADSGIGATDSRMGCADSQLRLIAKNVKHVLTHQTLFADFYLLETSRKPSLPADYIWVNESDIDHYAIPRLVDILLEKL